MLEELRVISPAGTTTKESGISFIRSPKLLSTLVHKDKHNLKGKHISPQMLNIQLQNKNVHGC